MRLLAETSSGRILSGSVDNYAKEDKPLTVRMRVDRINAILGTVLSQSEMVDILTGLEMKAEAGDGIIDVTPHYVRLDIKEEIDLSEEIGRIYGYDHLGMTLPRGAETATVSDSWHIRSLIRETLTGLGVAEIQTYSFVSPKGADKVGHPEDSRWRDFVRLINPLGEDTSVMRTELLPNLLEVLATNRRKNNDNVSLFEIGNTFLSGTEELPIERLHLAIGGYGSAMDFFTLKGEIEALLSRLGVKDARFEATENEPTWHPGRCANIVIHGDEQGRTIGTLGEVHPDVLDAYDFDLPVYVAEIDLIALIENTDLFRAYSPLDKYPAVTRDIALVVDEAVTVFEIEEIIRANGGALLESVKLFDIYRGKQIADGKKSMAFNLVYRAANKTLTDEEVAAKHDVILTALESKIGAILRDI
jgi:phenylalanyl-tRNA synthetase beta chain